MTSPVVDLHVHMVARQRDDCEVSTKALLSLATAYMVIWNQIDPFDLALHFDRTLREHILGAVLASENADKAVILALDGVYAAGKADADRTHVVTSNDYVREIAAEHRDRVLWGASINPRRDDALDEPSRCLEMDPPPALLKWIPNSQEFHPLWDVPDEFYAQLAGAGLPLLCHTGVEHAVPVAGKPTDYQEYGNPRHLYRALDIGVTVIAAHCATKFSELDTHDYLYELSEMMAVAEARGWKLYADVSAMCTAFRVLIIDDVLRMIPHDRMVLGSDYPVPVDRMVQSLVEDTEPRSGETHPWLVANPIDRNWTQLRAMGFPEEMGIRAGELLNPAALAASGA
jgi:predicted TIM-barrel fold metal-dependent hydrolase